MIDRQYKMSELTKYLISAAILIGSLLGMAGLYALKKDSEDRETVDTLPTVSTYAADAFNGKLGMEISGIVVPYREIRLSAEVAGRIERKTDACRAGKYVTAGTSLLTIEQKDYELEINRLTAELNQATVMVDELEDEIAGLNRTIEFAQKDYERRLKAGDALSESELDQAERNVVDLKNNLSVLKTRQARLESGMDLSNTLLEMANLNLQRTEIVAPFDGVIVSDMVEQGDYVQKGNELVVFEDTSKSEVKCNLRFDQLDRILKYQNHAGGAQQLGRAYRLPPTTVSIRVESSGQRFIWDGMLVRFDGIGVDEQTKMIPCRIVVDQPIAVGPGGQKALVRGMFVQVEIELDSSKNGNGKQLLSFPEVAVEPGDFVWTVKGDKLERHKIKLIDRHEVAASLSPNGKGKLSKMVVATFEDDAVQPGELIVVTPLANPTPGFPVRIIEQFTLQSVVDETEQTAIEIEADESIGIATADGGQS